MTSIDTNGSANGNANNGASEAPSNGDSTINGATDSGNGSDGTASNGSGEASTNGADGNASNGVSANGNASGTKPMVYKAVIFDMGGVVVKYKEPEFYRRLMTLSLSSAEFKLDLAAYEKGLISFDAIHHHLKAVPELNFETLDGPGLFDRLMGERDALIDQAIVSLKSHGFKIGLLTNNGWLDAAKSRSIIVRDLSLFDIVVESCREGLRKPGHEIYKLTAERLKVPCEECIFVDDLEPNCVAAKEVGMRAVHLANANSEAAVKEMEEVLSVKLSGEAN